MYTGGNGDQFSSLSPLLSIEALVLTIQSSNVYMIGSGVITFSNPHGYQAN